MNKKKKLVAIRHVAFEDLGYFEDIFTQEGFDISYLEAGRDDLQKRIIPNWDLLVV